MTSKGRKCHYDIPGKQRMCRKKINTMVQLEGIQVIVTSTLTKSLSYMTPFDLCPEYVSKFNNGEGQTHTLMASPAGSCSSFH